MPHLVRMRLVGDHQLAASLLCTGRRMFAAGQRDTLARTLVSPAEMPVGLMTIA